MQTKMKRDTSALSSAAVPSVLALGACLVEDNISMAWWGEVVDGLRMIQVHHVHCALDLYYYYISSTSDHQALESGGWEPMV